MHKFSFLSFFSIFSLIYFGGHYYVYHRIANGLCLSLTARYYLLAFFCLSALSFFLTRFFAQYFSPQVISPFVYFGNIWLGVISMGAAVFIVNDMLRIYFHGEQFSYYSTIVSLIALGLVSIYSFYNVYSGPVVKEIRIKTDKLPQGIENFSIVQLSDLHLDFLTPQEWLKKIVDQTNALNSDVVVITGDLIDMGIDHRDDFAMEFKRLSSKYGVFAVSGNHEYYGGILKFVQLGLESNINILRNNKFMISDFFELIGIDDSTGSMFGKTGSGMEDVLKTIDNNKLVVLLSHRPDVFEQASKFGIDLQLSGHTHAGQIPPMDLIVKFYFKHPYGFYSIVNPDSGKKSSIYTTSGTGTWGPPMRLFSQSEIVKIVFER